MDIYRGDLEFVESTVFRSKAIFRGAVLMKLCMWYSHIASDIFDRDDKLLPKWTAVFPTEPLFQAKIYKLRHAHDPFLYCS